MALKELAEFIERYKAQGLSFFPIPYKSKQSAIEWKEYQEHRPTDDEIARWTGNGDSNLAVVCGAISGNLVVLDFDSTDMFYTWCNTFYDHTGFPEILEYTRISQTNRGIHVWLRTKKPVKSQKFPQLDIKGEGGYIIAPPSIHESGAQYKFLSEYPIRTINSLAEIGIDINQQLEAPRNQPGWVSRLLDGVAEGGRNNAAIKLAGYFRNSLPQDVTERILLDWNSKNRPPLPEGIILGTVASSYRMEEHPPYNPPGYNTLLYNCPNSQLADTERHKSVTENGTTDGLEQGKVTTSLAKKIEDFVRESSGWFNYEDIDKEFGIKTESDKHNRRMIIKRLRDTGTIEAHQSHNKLFRFINTRVRLIDFKAATTRTPLAVKYPFGLERYFNTYPGNVIALAGAANSGKTAFLLNLIRFNQFDFPIYYQSSEMGKEELASRLEKFEGIKLEEWKFTAEERSKDFADVIRPDAINIIDYMELSADFYAVAEYLRQIHDKLGSGICLVALQKKRNAELGRGGDFGLEKPRLYLSMDAGKCTIQKAKNWVNPEDNPNGLVINFKIVGGCRFIITNDWHTEELK